MESAGFATRAQTETDLEAARWDLLDWEDPRGSSESKPFWADERMIEGAVVEPGDSLVPVGMTERATGINILGLGLRDGALVLKA